METHDVVNFLLKKGFQVTPEAADFLKGMSRLEFQSTVKKIVRDKNRNNDDNFMVSLEDVRQNVPQEDAQDDVGVDDYEVLDGNVDIQIPFFTNTKKLHSGTELIQPSRTKPVDNTNKRGYSTNKLLQSKSQKTQA